jgi:signal transduction histidine kinase
VQERTLELQRSNKELDQFAYVASHDLKAPLRAIDNLASWIAEDAAAVLSPPAQLHLSKLRSRVKRLEMLLDDLLLYSRAGRRRYTPETVDTAALVAGAVELLNPPPGFHVRIEGELPTIRCERLPLEVVLRNLLENAIKHHHRTQEGLVCIAAYRRDSDSMVEFHVTDNGPGIEPQFHERIFEVFQTLRPRDEVEGSGMGLAIVKKTVESAGGRVWVESTAGAGATFCFTWPAG